MTKWLYLSPEAVNLTNKGNYVEEKKVPSDLYIALRYQEVTFICNYVGGYVVPSFLTNFGALYLTEFSTNFGQILDSNSYVQA